MGRGENTTIYHHCTFHLSLNNSRIRGRSRAVISCTKHHRQNRPRPPARVHVVDVEKEMNFLDFFKEVGYLLPKDLNVSEKAKQ
eukprot:1726279-Ditylum_brightwellii.AAC.1